MKKIKFGTGGFRGVIGEDFTKEAVQTTCQAISNIIIRDNKKRRICVGYDTRFLSDQFAIWASEVFAGNGINVEFMDSVTSTPVVMYATMISDNDYGLMVTASHNPYKYNGLKIFVHEGRDASVEETLMIENEVDLIKDIKTMNYLQAIEEGIVVKVNYITQYVDNIIKLLDLKNVGENFNIVYDAMYGSTVDELDIFSKKIGCSKYEIINKNRDALFGFRDPAPSADNIDLLTNKVKENNADIGFALDADGDRLAVVDEKRNYIDNNYILAIAYYYFVKYSNKRGGSVKNVATSNLLDVVTEKLGYQCHEVPVGFKYVSSAIAKEHAVVGGESSGGLAIIGHIWGKDSLLAIAICLKAMSDMEKSFASILEEVKNFADDYHKVISDKKYTYNKSQKEYIDEVLFQKKLTPEHKYDLKRIVYKDYVKVYYENGNWAIIRFSGTEPILRIFVETDTIEENNEMISEWEQLLKVSS